MEDLKSPSLVRPLDRNNLANDTATLERLARQLNKDFAPDVAIANAPPQPTSIAQAARPMPPANLPPSAPPLAIPKLPGASKAPPAPKPLAAFPAFSFPAGTTRFFFTGYNKAGKSWLAAQAQATILELDDPIKAMAVSSFGEQADIMPFINEVFAWGEGLVNRDYPLTGARALFVDSIRNTKDSALFAVPFAEFGTPGFWTRSLIARALNRQGERVIVTNVFEAGQYTALKEAGFAPVHVTCNNVTRQARGGTGINPVLTDIVERDLVKQVSNTPHGSKLWAVWCDEQYPPPSPRLLTVHEFLSAL